MNAISILAGSILIDGCNIENIKFQSLRRHVGLVSQDSVSDIWCCLKMYNPGMHQIKL